MAVAFAAQHSRTSEYRFLPEDIKINPHLNGRHDKPDIEWLVADILKQGQIQPITIRNDGGQAVLVAGFSRWRAVSEINKRNLAPVKMQLRCTYVQCTEAEGFALNIAENRYRNDTTELDDAHNIKILLNRYALTDAQVAEVYFPAAKTPEELKTALKWVKKRIGLIGLTPEAAKAVKDGRVKGPAVQAIAKLSEEQQRDVVSKPGKVKGKDIAAVSGKPAGNSWKSKVEAVIETGKFPGIGGKLVTASDDMVEFLGSLVAKPKKGK